MLLFVVLYVLPLAGCAAFYTLYLFHDGWRGWMWEDGFRLALRGDGALALGATLTTFILPLVNIVIFYVLIRAWAEWFFTPRPAPLPQGEREA